MSGVIRLVSSLVPMFSKLDAATLKLYGKWALLGTAVMTLFSVLANWEKMGTAQKIIALLGALSAAALAAAVAFGAFHSAWSMGLAVAGIVAGIATAIAAVKSAEQEIGLDAGFTTDGYESAVESKRYELSSANGSSSSPVNSASNTYVDNSNTTINIEKNEYMTDEDIIKAVNRGLRQARQARA